MAGYFFGRARKDAEYELLSEVSPVESGSTWEPESHISQRHRPMEIRKALIRLWTVAILGTVLIVITFFVLIFVLQPYVSYRFEPPAPIDVYALDDDANSTVHATRWVQQLSASVSPVMCHSHNDYARRRPLFSGLAVGCTSTEADVWLRGEDLLVGHNRGGLSKDRTLKSLYIEPLLQILDAMNSPSVDDPTGDQDVSGVFASQPDITLILHIDVKDDPEKTWPVVLEQLKPLRDKGYLSRHQSNMTPSFRSGPITVVGTGNIQDRRDVNIGSDPDEWRRYHDVFLDAPLDLLTLEGSESIIQEARPNEFYTASVNFKKTIGTVITGFSGSQLRKMRDQIQAAKRLNLISRYWGLPGWPISHRDYVWRVLSSEEIGLLNADDVVSAATRRWGTSYLRDTVWISATASYLLAFSITMVWLGRRMIYRKLPAR